VEEFAGIEILIGISILSRQYYKFPKDFLHSPGHEECSPPNNSSENFKSVNKSSYLLKFQILQLAYKNYAITLHFLTWQLLVTLEIPHELILTLFLCHFIFTSINPPDYMLGKGLDKVEDSDMAEVGECARDGFVIVFEN